eukprot:355046-Ditylum_brightwellii.AAC.1
MGVTQKYGKTIGKFVDGYQPTSPRTNGRRSNVHSTPALSPIVDPCYACSITASKTCSAPTNYGDKA